MVVLPVMPGHHLEPLLAPRPFDAEFQDPAARSTLHPARHCHLLRNSFLSLLKYNHQEPIKILFLLEA